MITYAAARLAIFAHLESLGWTVKRNLKVPQAIRPDGGQLFFRPQAVYLGYHSLHCDIRTIPPAEFVAYVERWVQA